MLLTEGSNFTRMKNKYLTRSLCVTILSAGNGFIQSDVSHGCG